MASSFDGKREKRFEEEDSLGRVGSENEGQIKHVENTQRGLKTRHAQMIALGGTIGTGLFVGSGQALRMGGPAFLLVAYLLITAMVFGIVTCTTEISSYLPVEGSSVAYYGDRFFSPSLGFALGWMYWYIFTITVATEITAASIVIDYWNPPVNVAVWIAIMTVIIVALNCFPVQFYGETEFWFASLKVFGIIGLLIMAIVLFFGGAPTHDRLGFRYWNHPGAVNEYLVTGDTGRLAAFFGTTCFSIFAFAFAPELLVVTGGEMKSPRRNLPKAGKRYFWRLITFYVLGALAIGVIVPSDDPTLLGGGSGAGASPWAIAAKRGGIKALDSVINVVILTSAWSSGNSYLYLSSRILYSMAVSGNAPKIFKRCTKSGIPYYAVAASSSLTLLAFLNVSSSGATVFNWFANLINTGAYISWIAICVIYLRFRKATFVQEITDLPYRSAFQPVMAYITGAILTVLLLVNGFKNFVKGHWNTSDFLTAYIGIPLFFLFYFGHKFSAGRRHAWIRPAAQVDMISGLDEVLAKEDPPKPSGNWKEKLRETFT